jgi:uncharacterized repeat protein (TIGR03803 family)
MDAAGNLYGMTVGGGAAGVGTVFEFSPKTGGGWTGKGIHSFKYNNGVDGYNPEGSLIFDAVGNLYGTTSAGGAHEYGTVFELSPKTGGGWTEQIVHSFNDDGIDGYTLTARLLSIPPAISTARLLTAALISTA